MSQKPGRDPDGEPYTEPADPWGGQGGAWPVGPAAPQAGSPSGFGSPAFSSPDFEPSHGFDGPSQAGWAPPPRRRGSGTGIIVLVSVLAVLVVAGGGVAWWLATRDDVPPANATPTAAASSAAPTALPTDGRDARFVTSGQCVRNDGSEDVPQMVIAPCGDGAFEVLRRIDGATTGETDAQKKCAAVTGYSNWYFYDSELDALDFVLCLRGK